MKSEDSVLAVSVRAILLVLPTYLFVPVCEGEGTVEERTEVAALQLLPGLQHPACADTLALHSFSQVGQELHSLEKKYSLAEGGEGVFHLRN